MTKKIPPNAIETEVFQTLSNYGFTERKQAKTIDTYEIDSDFILQVFTDRVNAFDFDLNATVPDKGQISAALNYLWFMQIFPDFPNHLANTNGINDIHNFASTYPGIDKKRCFIIRNLSKDILKTKYVLREHIGGAVYEEYKKFGTASGQRLKPNLSKWSKLRKPIFTPKQKNLIGHDEIYDTESFFNETKDAGKEWIDKLLELCTRAYAYTGKRGIIFMDTRFEGTLTTLTKEILTTDSTRFILKKDWKRAMKLNIEPDFFDNTPIKKWARSIPTPFSVQGLNNLDPSDPIHISWVHKLSVPKKVIAETAFNEHTIFELLAGMSLENFQKKIMNC